MLNKDGLFKKTEDCTSLLRLPNISSQNRVRKRNIMKLERLTDKPILLPNPKNDWEKSAVFNAAAIYSEGKVHLFYRATNIPPTPDYQYVSSIGYAVSDNGIDFKRFDKPLLYPKDPQETRGLEDPRVVKIEDTFYMAYTGFGGRPEIPDDYRIMLAKSKDLKSWERLGVVLDEPNKDASLFPERINGRYVLLHRRYPNIWIAFADSLEPLKKETFKDHTEILKTRPNSWECARVGIAGPPVKVKHGWMLIYHAADDKNVYRLGAALLDEKDPTKVLSRQQEPILEPELDWEINGAIPNVVFSCGQVEIGDDIFVYYGGADEKIGVAKINKNQISFD